MYLHQFVLHAALDAVNEQVWTTTSMHLGNVDKFNNLLVAAYATAAHVKFLLLHDGRNDETIRLFFKDVYDIYVRVSGKATHLSGSATSAQFRPLSSLYFCQHCFTAGLYESIFHNSGTYCVTWLWPESENSGQDTLQNMIKLTMTTAGIGCQRPYSRQSTSLHRPCRALTSYNVHPVSLFFRQWQLYKVQAFPWAW